MMTSEDKVNRAFAINFVVMCVLAIVAIVAATEGIKWIAVGSLVAMFLSLVVFTLYSFNQP